MFKFLGNKRLIILLLGFILFIALMGLTLGERGSLTWPEKFIKDSISWTQGLFYKPARVIAGFFQDIHELRITYEENKTLKRTLSNYARDTARLNELESENTRLKTALQFTERQKLADHYTYRIAEVVAVSPDPYNHTITINLGLKDGIKQDMAVTSTEGLVGRIVEVSEFYSNVQLLTDIDEGSSSSKAIAATVQGNENISFGMIENYSKGMLVMEKIDPEDPLKPGDTIVTSGLGQVFPKGLIIGEVVSKGVGLFGITHTAIIQPAATFDHLQEVFVVEIPEMR